MNEEIKSLKDYISTTKNEIFTTFKIETISNLIICYEDLQQKVEQLEERCAYLERSNNRREDEIIELRNENVDLVSKNNQLENIRKEAIKFIEEKISSTKGVINDYMYHKEYNKILIELLQEDIELYNKELNILNKGSGKDV